MKKNNFLIGLFITLSLLAFAGPSPIANPIPANVQNTFKTLYPNATNAIWEQEQNYYIATLKVNNTRTKVIFDVNGKRLQTSTKIVLTALPGPAGSYIAGNYPGQTIADIERLTTVNNTTTYEVLVTGHDLLFDATGKFIKLVRGPLKQ